MLCSPWPFRHPQPAEESEEIHFSSAGFSDVAVNKGIDLLNKNKSIPLLHFLRDQRRWIE
jgi:hypothetical protein